ncbi:hypothetical protein DFH09DRAFT_1377302 [Mycena vulgaris]|nr:hypothetical protein DFH09DRAFT_1377302 [Mycena vulgaris]
MAKASGTAVRRSPRKHDKKKPSARAVKAVEPPLPKIKWSAENGTLTWALIGQMEVKDNRLVLFGKDSKDENTSGDSKIAVYKRIGSVIMPELFATSPNALAKRVKSKAEDLVATYKDLAKELQDTGGGLRNDDEDDSDSTHKFLECYISPEGPDHDTTEKAKNLWDKLTKKCVYFSALHRFLSARSNIIPPVITTGVGPHGRQVLHLQPPAQSQSFVDANIDPTLQNPATPEHTRSLSPDPPSSPIRISSSPLVPAPKSSRDRVTSTASTFQRAVAKAKAHHRPSKKSFEDNLVEMQA